LPGGQENDDLVSLIDVTRTIFAAAGVQPAQADRMPGRSLLPRYDGDPATEQTLRQAVYSGRERHSSSRYRTLGYPCRCVRTKTHLYIRNFAPERYPAGAPRKFANVQYDEAGNVAEAKLGPVDGGYHDIDACPTLDWMIEHQDDAGVKELFELAVRRRPAEELYDVVEDPACLNNLADDPASQSVKAELATRLTDYLRQTGDVRVTDPENADVWETYPRVSHLRWFPEPQWAKRHPENVPEQPWLEKRRP
jgi:uncharacterized sulfatase